MQIMHEDAEIKIVEFDPSDSDADIETFIARCERLDQMNSWRVCISSFDDDPRELIEIPEARQFARRLIDRGILPSLELPMPDGSYILQIDAPGLDGLAIHAISNGSGEVRRKGKRVHIGMDIDIVSYFTDLLKTLKERKAPASLIQSVEKAIENKSKFDPLQGSSKFLADTAFDEVMRQNDEKWPNRLNEGFRQMG